MELAASANAPPNLPANLTLPLLNGSVFHVGNAIGSPVVFNAFDPASGFSTCLWQLNQSVDEFIHAAFSAAMAKADQQPYYVFLSHAAAAVEAEEEVTSLRTRIQARLSTLDLPAYQHALWTARIQYVPAPVSSLNPFIHSLLSAWPTSTDFIILTSATGGARHIRRLDPRYDWVGWNFNPSAAAFGNASLPVVDVGDACTAIARGVHLAGKVAFARSSSSTSGSGVGSCDYYDQMRNVQRANASALVVWAPAGQTIVDMNCHGADECDDQNVGLPATMITHEDGLAVLADLKAGASVHMSFQTAQSIGTDFLIDSNGQLQQSWGGTGTGSHEVDGNPGDRSAKLYPRLSFVAWAARYALYQRAVSAQLGESAMVVSVFETAPLRLRTGDCYGAKPWGCGPWATVMMPASNLFDRWTVDLSLGCNGTSDVVCPQWDHVVSLRACVLPPGGTCDAQAGPEIGRWVTSFGRRIGRWLLDITPIAPLLASSGRSRSVNLTIYSAPWAGDQGAIPWLATLRLRMRWKDGAERKTRADEARGRRPVAGIASPEVEAAEEAEVAEEAEDTEVAAEEAVVAEEEAESAEQKDGEEEGVDPHVLQPWADVTTEIGGVGRAFRWIALNQSYAANFAPFAFTLQRSSRRTVRLYAVITGHGNDNHGCGEFCATEHRFSINGHAPVVKQSLLPATNQQLGCAEEVDSGVTPNEYGTWLYGRDGWCNGRHVIPWVADVSEQVYAGIYGREGNFSATLSYSAVWCRLPLGNTSVEGGPLNCSAPDPGPSSTWSQAAPVMMVSVYVVLGRAVPLTPWWKDPWVLCACGLGALATVAAAAIAGRQAGNRWLRRRSQMPVELRASWPEAAAAVLLENDDVIEGVRVEPLPRPAPQPAEPPPPPA